MGIGKRPRGISDSEDDETETEPYWPRFLVITPSAEDDSLKNLSPFAISLGIKGLAGTAKSIRKMGQNILVEVNKKAHADNLLKSTMFVNIPVQVSEHNSLNTRKGVIRCRDLAGMEEDEICRELASQAVSKVDRIIIKKNKPDEKKTDTYVLTFRATQLPDSIKVGYLNVRVSTYIPNPLRCFRCQAYGHGKNQCKSTKVRCGKCGGDDHEADVCTADKMKCFHCGEEHGAWDRKCPKYLQEKQINTIKYTENISFPEARRRVTSNQRSYSSVTQSSLQPTSKHSSLQTMDATTQTDLFWPKDQDHPSFMCPPPPQSTSDSSIQTNPTQTSSFSSPNFTKPANLSGNRGRSSSVPKPSSGGRGGNTTTIPMETDPPARDKGKTPPPGGGPPPGNSKQKQRKHSPVMAPR